MPVTFLDADRFGIDRHPHSDSFGRLAQKMIHRINPCCFPAPILVSFNATAAQNPNQRPDS